MKALRALLALGVSVGLLAFVATRVDGVGEGLAHMSWPWLLAAAALGPAQVAVGGWRWARVSRVLGVPLAPVEAVFEVGLSTALNQVLPGGVAGDVVRVARQREQGAGVLAAAVVDRACGLVSLIAVTGAGLALWPLFHGPPPAVLVGALAASAVGVWLGNRSRYGAALRDPGVVGASLGLTLSFLVGFACVGRAVGVPAGPWALTAAPWLLLAMALPLSFAGWGPREVAALWVWPLAGASDDEGVRVSAAYGISVLLGSLPGGLAWAVWNRPTGGRGSRPSSPSS